MNSQGIRLPAALAMLAVLWVGVYWWWEPTRAQPTISLGVAPGISPAESPAPPETDSGDLAEPSVEAWPPPAPPRQPTPVSEAPVVAEPAPADPVPPARAVEPPAPVQPPAFRTYAVRAGDTFESIAARELGSSRLASAIARSNPFVDPRRLRVGREIRIPIDPANIQGRPAAESGGGAPAPLGPIEYLVQSGDTLSGIASRVYGSSAFARQIFEANRDTLSSMDDLRVGQRLRLPPAPAAAEDNGEGP